MTSRFTILSRRLLVLWLLSCALPAFAEHAVIDLSLISPDGTVKAQADEEPPLGGVSPRPVIKVKRGDPLAMNFVLINAYPHGRLKDVSVRYYIVRTDKVGDKSAPDLSEGKRVVYGETTQDFKPKTRVGARVKFRIDEAGVYLVRVETANTKSDHEHFAALDLVVE